MAYYVDVTLIAAWCELRNDFRHFRVDRIAMSTPLEERFEADHAKLLAAWQALQKDREMPMH
jgi:predicted DNA-binding transcriptional regulator YafY